MLATLGRQRCQVVTRRPHAHALPAAGGLGGGHQDSLHLADVHNSQKAACTLLLYTLLKAARRAPLCLCSSAKPWSAAAAAEVTETPEEGREPQAQHSAAADTTTMSNTTKVAAAGRMESESSSSYKTSVLSQHDTLSRHGQAGRHTLVPAGVHRVMGVTTGSRQQHNRGGCTSPRSGELLWVPGSQPATVGAALVVYPPVGCLSRCRRRCTLPPTHACGLLRSPQKIESISEEAVYNGVCTESHGGIEGICNALRAIVPASSSRRFSTCSI